MEWSIGVYRTDTPEGVRDYVSCLPHEHVFSRGLNPAAIVGVLLRPLEAGEAITPEVFARNRAFVDFMHEVISRRGPDVPGLVEEARKQREGWVYLIDQRTRTPGGSVPPEDVVGGFEVKGGRVVPGSYRPNPQHRILTPDGFFDLGSELRGYLLKELLERA